MKKTLDLLLGRILVALLTIMVLSVLWQIFSRYLAGSPSTVTEEISRYVFIWLGILGAAYAAGQRTHLAIDIFPQKLNVQNRKKLQIFINVLILLFSIGVLIVGGGNLVYVNFILGQTSAALEIPLAYVYTVLPIGGCLVVYYKINEIMNPEKYLS